MTIEEISLLSDEELRVRCAELCGWHFYHDADETIMVAPGSNWPQLPHWIARGMIKGDGRPSAPLTDLSLSPNYPADLNAMHEALKLVPHEKQPYYMDHLTRFVMMKSEGVSDWERHNATARQRCIAFIAVMQSQ